MVLTLASCGKTDGGETTEADTTTTSDERAVKTKVVGAKDTLGMVLAKLKADRSYAYDVKLCNDYSEVKSLISSGDADIACLPLDEAAKLYNETDGGIQIIAINQLLNMAVYERGSSIQTLDDIKGKTVYMSGENTLADCLVKKLFSDKNVSLEKDVTLKYVSSDEELISLAKDGTADVIITGQNYAGEILSADEVFHKALILVTGKTDEGVAKQAYGCTVARKDYIDANPDLISEFLMLYEVCVNFMASNEYGPTELLVAEGFYTTGDDVLVTNFKDYMFYAEGENMKTPAAVTFEIVHNFSPEIIGGKVPADDIYYMP